MKIIVIGVILIVVGIFIIIIAIATLNPYRIEQEVRVNGRDISELATYVWKDQIIVKSWHDPIDKVDSLLIENRKQEAQDLINVLKCAN